MPYSFTSSLNQAQLHLLLDSPPAVLFRLSLSFVHLFTSFYAHSFNPLLPHSFRHSHLFAYFHLFALLSLILLLLSIR